MTGLRRNVGLLVAFTLLSTVARASPARDVDQDFQEGVELLRRGKDAARGLRRWEMQLEETFP